MVIPSILVLCVASSTDASDQVLDLPEVVVQPSLIPGLLAFDRSPSLGQSHIQLDPTDFQIDRSLPEVMQAFPGVQVQKTGHGQGVSIPPWIHRSAYGALLVDGIRFDDTVFREGPVQYWNTLDPESFAEVLFSPASFGFGRFRRDRRGCRVDFIQTGSFIFLGRVGTRSSFKCRTIFWWPPSFVGR